MKKKLLLSVSLFIRLCVSASAQDMPDAVITQKIKDEGMTHSKVMQTAFYLTM